jgi:hypothetical protein
MKKKGQKSAISSVWNAGTAVNVLLIPVITLVFMAGGFYAYTNTRFMTYDRAAADVILIQLHNAGQDEKVQQMIVQLAEIKAQLSTLRLSSPTGIGGGAGGNSDGPRDRGR